MNKGVYCGRVSKDSNEPFAVEATNFTTSKCLQYDVYFFLSFFLILFDFEEKKSFVHL